MIITAKGRKYLSLAYDEATDLEDKLQKYKETIMRAINLPTNISDEKKQHLADWVSENFDDVFELELESIRYAYNTQPK
jgi:formyltetrahydrofolate synthetase